MLSIKNKYTAILWLLILCYIAYFSFFSIARHRNFQSSFYDLAIMDQTVYNTSKGRILELTDPTGVETIRRMAIHNDLILALLAPFYVVHKGPETLLIIQSVVVALGAWFVYKLAIKVLGSQLLSLVFAVSYLMYPSVQYSTLFDFHAVVLATTFMLATVYFLVEKKFSLAALFLILANLCKEQIAATTVFLGLFLIWQYALSLRPKISVNTSSRYFQFGAAAIILGLLWFYIQVWVIIPHFRGSAHFAIDRYREFGTTPEGVMIGIFTKPHQLTAAVFNIATAKYLFFLLAPLGFLSLAFPPQLVVALPEFFINILSNSNNMTDIIHQYTAVITPFVFTAAVYGAKTLLSRYRNITCLRLAFFLIIFTLVLSYIKSPLPYSRQSNMARLTVERPEAYDVAQWRRILEDEDIAVSASDALAPHFSSRRVISRFSTNYSYADYVVLFKNNIENDWYDAENTRKAYEDLRHDQSFKLEYTRGDFEVYKKI